MRNLLLLLLSVTLLGCYGRLKREAPHMADVKTQVFDPARPAVRLDTPRDGSAVGIVVDAYQTGQAIRVARRIEGAVEVPGISHALERGIGEGLDGGPPFAHTTERQADGTLQLEVLRWGLEVPRLGAPGHFTYRVRVRLFRKDGRRIYRQRVRCDTAAGAPPEISMVLGTVNNVRQLEEMPDEELQAAFEEVARWCGMEVARRIRQHAG